MKRCQRKGTSPPGGRCLLYKTVACVLLLSFPSSSSSSSSFLAASRMVVTPADVRTASWILMRNFGINSQVFSKQTLLQMCSRRPAGGRESPFSLQEEKRSPFGLGIGGSWGRSKVLWMNKYQPGRRVIIKLWLGGRNWWSRRGLVQRDFSSFYFFNNFYFYNFEVFELQCSTCFNGSFLNDYFICLRNEWNNNAFMNSDQIVWNIH